MRIGNENFIDLNSSVGKKSNRHQNSNASPDANRKFSKRDAPIPSGFVKESMAKNNSKEFFRRHS